MSVSTQTGKCSDSTPDIVHDMGKDYNLAGIGADGLFEPMDHGMTTWEQSGIRRALRRRLEELKSNLGNQIPAL